MPAKKRTPKKISKKPGETGRPLLDIDVEEVKRLASIGASERDYGDWFGCSGSTIVKRFSDVIAKHNGRTRSKLRQKQIQLALEGDKTMLIWLGKQMLGQTESPSVAIQNNVQNVAPARSKADDEAFIAQFEKVVSSMPPVNGDALRGKPTNEAD